MKNGNSLYETELSVKSDKTLWARGPIKQMAVYKEVMSVTSTGLSGGKFCFNHAWQRVCWIVGAIIINLEEERGWDIRVEDKM